MPSCPNCSNTVDTNTQYCLYCDHPLKPEEQSQRNIVSPSLTVPQVASVESALSGVSKQVSALMTRYEDAYLVAKVTNGFGRIIKTIGVIIAALLVVIGFAIAGQGSLGDAGVALGVIVMAFGVITGIGFYIVGVLVSAQGQILKATLDGAVNNSPFLTNEQRANIMSLPEA